MKWSDDYALLETIANAKFFHLAHQPGYKFVVDLVEQVEPLDCQASLTAIEEAPNGCGAHGFLDISIVANDHRVAAAKLQSDPLDVLCRNFHDVFTGRGRARETDLAYPRIRQQRFADDPSRSRNNIEHARRQPRFVENLDHLNVRQWRAAGRLNDDGVAGDQGRSDLVT